MTVKTGAAWSGLIVTLDATGAKATPSVGPAGTLYVNGTADAASVTISGSNPYKWTVTLPALSAGDRVSMYITATISSIATAAVVAEEQADTYIISDIESLVDDIGAAGAGLTAIPWNAAWDAEVESEVDDALGSGTGTSLTAIPWNAAWDAEVESEVDDALGSGTGTALTAIPWNAAWDAEVQSEATDALNAYDPPTNAEMELRTLPAADYVVVTDTIAGVTTVATVTNLTNAPTNGDLTATMKASVTTAATSATPTAAAVTGAVGSVTGNVGGNVTGSVGSLATQAKADVNAEVVDALTVDVIADSVATDGSRPTIAQALLEITRFLMERSVSSTTMTVKKEDGTTASMTFTLDDATSPTAITRAS